jgi:hypothetical protein
MSNLNKNVFIGYRVVNIDINKEDKKCAEISMLRINDKI